MLKRKEKKSKPQREGYKLHERLLSGVLAAATALSFVPVPEVKATIPDVDPVYVNIPTTITRNHESYNEPTDDPYYRSSLTTQQHYAFASDFMATYKGENLSIPGLCSAAGVPFDKSPGNWNIDYTTSNDINNIPLWRNLLDYYWGFLANQEEIDAICDITKEDPITDYGYGTTKGDERYKYGLWPYWTATASNGYTSYADAELKLRALSQAIHWWCNYLWDQGFSNPGNNWAPIEVLSGVVGEVSAINSYSDYVPSSAAESAIQDIARDRAEIEYKWGLRSSNAVITDDYDNIKRMIYYCIIIQDSSDPYKPATYRSVYGDRYNISYAEYTSPSSTTGSYQPFVIGFYDFMVTAEDPGSWHSAVGVQKVDGSKF